MKKYLLAGALAAAASIGGAHAANITYDSYSFTGIGSIHVTSPNDITGGAGPITLYNQGKVVVSDAWCMDLGNYLAGSGTVGVLLFTLAVDASGLPGVPTNLTATQLGVVSWLIVLGDKATDDTLKGAFQIAIWSEEYGASFQYDSLGAPVTNAVSADLATALADYTGGGNAPLRISFLVPGVDANSQTLAFGSPVPEPSTWAMMLLGFAGLGYASYRSTRRTAAISVRS